MNELRTGNPISCQSAEAAQHYQRGIDLLLGSQTGAAEALDQALALQPEFALAAVARYLVAKDAGESEPERFKSLAETLLDDISPWERQHVELLVGIADNPSETIQTARDYLKSCPADMLVLSQLSGYLFFYGGPEKKKLVLELLESVYETLKDDWAYLARLGFAASESGDRIKGRAFIQQALEQRPESLYSIHALAHVLHDDGAATESAQILKDWLSQYEQLASGGQMYGHVQWHLALAEWQLGERDKGLKRYYQYCAPETTTCGPVLTLADVGGFLLRDYLSTNQFTALDQATISHIEKFWGMIGHPFIALHVGGLFASAGDMVGLNRCQDNITKATDGPNKAASEIIIKALIQYVEGNYQMACQSLKDLSSASRIGIGGSNVERELLELLEANASRLAEEAIH